MVVKASIVIRAYNEERWLPELLSSIAAQDVPREQYEIILVDSGSTDRTVEFASAAGAKIVRIAKEDFSFGRSLNLGCEVASGDYLVFISAHCIPIGSQWLSRLIAPLENGIATYVYGRQQAHAVTKFSEKQLFLKYFPSQARLPQTGFFCNNANSAITRDAWARHRFDEGLTGLEDMELAKRLVRAGAFIGYVADASVYHIHEESWSKVRVRYEREAIALQVIMPEVHIHMSDLIRYVASSIFFDCAVAIEQRVFLRRFNEICMFRVMQYWGAYRGNNQHRKLSTQMKHAYFYPR